ncbi:MAG: NAD-dependent epimerase/dehydratase family protein [Acidimicrobiia bacterium]
MAPETPVLITGATGFIGSRLTRTLAGGGRDVHLLVRDQQAAASQFAPQRVHLHPVAQASHVISTVDPVAIFHLATRYERHDPVDPGPMRLANVEFGAEVLESASVLRSCKVVVAGSQHQVASADGGPTSAYAASKQELAGIAASMSENGGLEWIQTILYDIYGPGDTRDKLIPNTIAAVKDGTEIHLPDNPPLLSFCHVDDAVSALLAAYQELESDRAAVGRSVFARVEPLATPQDVVAMVGDVLGIEPRISPEPYVVPASGVPEPPDGPHPMGWRPTIGLEAGISEIVNAQ